MTILNHSRPPTAAAHLHTGFERASLSVIQFQARTDTYVYLCINDTYTYDHTLTMLANGLSFSFEDEEQMPSCTQMASPCRARRQRPPAQNLEPSSISRHLRLCIGRFQSALQMLLQRVPFPKPTFQVDWSLHFLPVSVLALLPFILSYPACPSFVS